MDDDLVNTPFEGTVEVVAPLLPTVMDPVGSGADLVVPLPGPQGRPGAAGAGIVHTQETPESVWIVQHNLNRSGPVGVVVTSLDYETMWDNVVVQRMSSDVVRLVFDDPTAGHALIQ